MTEHIFNPAIPLVKTKHHYSLDDGEYGRIALIRAIIRKLLYHLWSLPSASEERLYEESLAHIARICSDNMETPPQGTVILNVDLVGCGKSKCRKHQLKKMLFSLQSLERKRLYDPPADDEIPYYLLIKRYIRCLITFFDARNTEPASRLDEKFGFYRLAHAIGPVQELVELNWHFADLSTFVSRMDIRKDSAVKPWLGILNSKVLPPVTCGSKHRSSNMFYHHKFNLAMLDLHRSEFSRCPASADEKRCYAQASDGLTWNYCFTFREKMDLYADELKYLLCERIHHETHELARHFKRIVRSTFEKLHISEHWQSLTKRFVRDPFEYEFCEEDDNTSSKRERENNFVDLGKELAKKVGTSLEDIPHYITYVDQFLSLASNMYHFLHEQENLIYSICFLIGYSQIPGTQHRARLGWEALHIVTLLKRGSLSNGDIYRTQPTLSNFSHKGHRDLFGAKKNNKLSCQDKGQNENVKILEGIIEDLRHIIDSDVSLDADAEEKLLTIKIWYNVASSVHFFLCAMAFEQKHLVMGCHQLPSASMLGLRKTRKMKNSLLDTDKFYHECSNKSYKLVLDARNLKIFLDSYKNGLLQIHKN